MNKQDFYNMLNEKYENQIIIIEAQGNDNVSLYIEENNYSIKHWIVGEILCEITTYCDDYSDKWYRLFVDFIAFVHTKPINRSLNKVIKDEEFMLCFNMFRANGWLFDWGTNIYRCWIDWDKTNVDFYDVGYNNTYKLSEDYLKYCLDWLK
jgi:hypothetical protein